MSEILYIEGKQVDLTPNSITRNLQINDIGEVKDRQANYSNTFKLPKTPNNVKVFDYLGVSGNNSIKPYRKLACKYLVNGIPLVQDGYAVVRETPREYYEVVIYDGIIDLSERIKGKKVNELDFSDLNHYLTQSNYENSLSNTEGYIYAIAEFIPRASLLNIRVEEQAPSLFVSTVWDKIWNEAGLRYTGDFFIDSLDFKTEVITPIKGYDVQDIPPTDAFLGTAQTNTISELRLEDNQFSTEEEFILTGGIVTNNQIVIGFDGQAKLELDVDYNLTKGWLNILVEKNGKFLSSIYLAKNASSKSAVILATVKTNDVLTIKARGYSEENFEGSHQLDFNLDAAITLYKQLGGQFIDFSLFTTNMDQLDFVKDVMQRYGLIVKYVGDDRYEFIKLEEQLNDRENAEDWSSKLNRLEGEKYNIKYARENDAKYKYPKDIVDNAYDGVILIDNDNAKKENTLFTSPFEVATKRISLFKNKDVFQVPIWEEKDEDGVILKENVETPAKVFRISRIDDSITTKFFDNANTVTVSGLIPFLSMDNMSMQYFINNNYKSFSSLINRVKQVDASFLLSEIDIYNIDFFKLKYLNQTGEFYYLNTLNHTTNRLKKANLVQLNEFSVNQPPTILGVYSISMTYQGVRNLTVTNITDQSNPAYFDPEFDEPLAIKFTGGFSPDILLKNGTQVINTETEILIENWDVTIEDAGNTTAAHSTVLTFKIKDTGSGKYSEVQGSVEVDVAEFIDQPPVANAGADQSHDIDSGSATVDYVYPLDGTGSTDDVQISSYSWSIISSPTNNTCYLTDANTSTPVFNVPNDTVNDGIHTVELTVTDSNAVSDTDTMTVTITDINAPV